MKRLFWGASRFAWRKQLIRSKVKLKTRVAPSFVVSTAVCGINSALGQLQKHLFNERLAQVNVRVDPIVVVGHWRSGTTLLHELLSLHPDVTFPNNYCCFSPHHFLMTERSCASGFDFFAPFERPMDSVNLVWDAPQEDEFATCGLGADSVYWRFGFPSARLKPIHQFDFEDQNGSWNLAFSHLVRMLSFRSDKRLVLKSPTHSFRIPALSEMFRDIRFVFVFRDPVETVRSFRHMLREILGFGGFERTELPKMSELAEGLLSLTKQVHNSTIRLQTPIVGIHFDALRRDPISIAHSLASELGLSASPEFTRRLRRHLGLCAVNPPRSKLGCDISPRAFAKLDATREYQTGNWMEMVDNDR